MTKSVIMLETVVYGILGVVAAFTVGMVENIRDFQIPLVYDQFTYKDVNDVETIVWSPRSEFNYKIGVVLAVAPFLTFIPLALQWIMPEWRFMSFNSGMNPWRWLTRSITYPLITTAVIAAFGMVDMLSLISLFALSHACVLLGWFMEMSNPSVKLREKYTPNWATMVASLWISLLSWLPSIVTFSVAQGGPDVPALLWAAFGVQIGNGMVSGFIQILYFAYLANPAKGRWLFTHKRGREINYAIYDSYLAASGMVFDIVTISLLLAAGASTDSISYPVLA